MFSLNEIILLTNYEGKKKLFWCNWLVALWREKISGINYFILVGLTVNILHYMRAKTSHVSRGNVSVDRLSFHSQRYSVGQWLVNHFYKLTIAMYVLGKALIRGRKALENRRFIKHLISEQDSTGFKSDLNAASSRILGEKRNLVDKNKVKRLVMKHQTLETKHSLIDSILRAKVHDK